MTGQWSVTDPALVRTTACTVSGCPTAALGNCR